jgi:hypothetical protein
VDVTNMTDAQVLEAFEAWAQDEAQEWCAPNSRAQHTATSWCVGYEYYAPRGFEWSDVTAEQILEVGNPMPWRTADLETLRSRGVEVEELLVAIEQLRLLKVEAARWVLRILAEYASSYDPLNAGTSGGDVLEFLDEVTYEMPELMRKRLESPALFGEICLEFERVLLNMQDDEAIDSD